MFDFVFPVFDDRLLVMRLILELRQLYPQANLACVCDFSPEVGEGAFTALCQAQGVHLIFGDRLKQPQFGGLWLDRLFQVAMAYTQSPWIIRTEGDTRFFRQFASPPNSDIDIAGTLNNRHSYPFARGGCMAIQRRAMQTILDSNLLKDSVYCNNPNFLYLRYSKWRYEGEKFNPQPVLLSDLVLGDVANRLNLRVGVWGEVDIQFRDRPTAPNPAASHPHR